MVVGAAMAQEGLQKKEVPQDGHGEYEVVSVDNEEEEEEEEDDDDGDDEGRVQCEQTRVEEVVSASK